MKDNTGHQLLMISEALKKDRWSNLREVDHSKARIAVLEALLGEANTILEIGESINPGCVLHSEIKAALAKKELSE